MCERRGEGCWDLRDKAVNWVSSTACMLQSLQGQEYEDIVELSRYIEGRISAIRRSLRR
jgi:hypothetical protein